jgi:hypothetical protein
MTISSKRYILKWKIKGAKNIRLNYSRRMYSILRKYSPSVYEGKQNECFVELTGLRTFFKMSYEEMRAKITYELENELGKEFISSKAEVAFFDALSPVLKKQKKISTYAELSPLLERVKVSSPYTQDKLLAKRKVRLTVPFLGKVK